MMKTIDRLISAVGLVALSVCALPAAGSASTVLVDKGSYTYDSASGLDWLDVSATAGFSYNQVEHNHGVNYVADGWRYATVADLKTLSADIGMAIPDGFDGTQGDVPAWIDAVTTLGDLFGWSVTTTDYNTLFGIYGPTVHGITGEFDFSIFNPDTADAQASITNFASTILGNTKSEILDGTEFPLGSFLVRDADVAATPLPGASLLFASGLGLIGFVAWRRKRGDISLSIAPAISPAVCA
jgi:hypothetical protein